MEIASEIDLFLPRGAYGMERHSAQWHLLSIPQCRDCSSLESELLLTCRDSSSFSSHLLRNYPSAYGCRGTSVAWRKRQLQELLLSHHLRQCHLLLSTVPDSNSAVGLGADLWPQWASSWSYKSFLPYLDSPRSSLPLLFQEMSTFLISKTWLNNLQFSLVTTTHIWI